MQVFGNTATQPERKQSKATGKGYYEFRLCEPRRPPKLLRFWPPKLLHLAEVI